MPEIGEVARVVHYLRKHVVGRTIAKCTAEEDTIVYGKVGTSATAFQKALTGRKVMAAKQQGKYFWLELDKAPHPLMHLGMTGWIKFSNDHYSSYRAERKAEDTVWPPRFVKFMLELKGQPECSVAFVDARRLARIRLIDVEAKEMRNTTPLKENGPDPVVDKGVVTTDWLTERMAKRRVPVKALLLNQAFLSGIGNWVADEICYQARIHPEQYSDTFSTEQIKRLHGSLLHVCNFACDILADYSKIPDDWLMKYRWGKGKKDGGYLPNGDKIIHLTVGGRTSAVVPSVQKKTGAVAGETMLEDEQSSNAESAASSVEDVKHRVSKGRKRKSDVEDEEVDGQDDVEKKPSKSRRTTKSPKKEQDEKPKVNGNKKVNGTKKAPLRRKNTVAEHAVDDLPGEPAEEDLEPLKSKSSKRKTLSSKASPKSSEGKKGAKVAATKPTQRHPKAKADEKRFGKPAEAPAEAQEEAPSGRRRSARMSARAG